MNLSNKTLIKLLRIASKRLCRINNKELAAECIALVEKLLLHPLEYRSEVIDFLARIPPIMTVADALVAH